MSLIAKFLRQKPSLNPKESFWQELVRNVEWSDGFCLIFLFSPKPNVADEFRERLANKFSHSTEQLQCISPSENFSKEDLVSHIITQLNELSEIGQNTNAPIWVELDRNTTTQAISILFARINERRELLRNHLHRPVIFILPSGYKQQLRELSPDLWSIRDYSFNLGDLEEIYKKTLADTILKKLSTFTQWHIENICALFSGFHRHYNKHIIYEHRVFNVRGLRTMGTFTIELEQVFVELRIAPSTNIHQANFDPVSAKKLAGNRPIWDFLQLKKPQERRVLAIIGAPGCGKTTLLQHIALTLATRKQRHYAFVPLLLFLRHHVKQIIADEPPTLHEVAQDYFYKPEKQLNPPPRWFKQQLENGKCLVLLDGLDEIAERQQRQAVSAWVDQQIINYPHCHFIITSRPQGYFDAPLQQAMLLEVQAFNTKQVKRFIHNWYLANEVTAFGGKIDDGVRYKARDAADDLLNRLRGLPALSELTVNPLLLTMIAMVHRYRGQLPGRRVELYAEICDVLLGHWQEGKGLQDSLTAAQKRVALQPLAAEMMQRKLRDILTDEAMHIITKPLKRVGLSDQFIQSFLKDLQASSGLFLEGEVGEWRFAHLTFQEYLAAAYFLEQRIELEWNAIVNESWWHETLRLYAAQGDATLLVQACLDQNNVTSLTLATDLVEEARELDKTVRKQVESLLIDDLESNDRQPSKFAAEVRLNRRLKSLLRIDEQREIDLDYITCAEYQLFLDEKRAGGEYYQPDHWTEYTFPKGAAQEPIRGVRVEDAEEFCVWLTQRQGDEIAYRLPLPLEIQDYPPKRVYNNLATWCKKKYLFFKNLKNKGQTILLINNVEYLIVGDIALLRARDIAIAYARDISRADTRALARARYLAGYLARYSDLNHIYHAIEDNNLKDAKKLTQAIMLQKTETAPTRQQLAGIISELLTCATAETFLEARQAWRQYLVILTEYILSDDHHLHYNLSCDKEKLLTLKEWLEMIIKREKGELPALEGIRIVRERKNSE